MLPYPNGTYAGFCIPWRNRLVPLTPDAARFEPVAFQFWYSSKFRIDKQLFVARPFVRRHSERRPQPKQFANFVRRQPPGAADRLRQDQHPAVGVENFGIPERMFERITPADRAVVAQQDRSSALCKWSHGGCKFLTPRRFIGSNRDDPQENFNLRNDARRNLLAGDCKGRRVRRMTVDHGACARVLAIYLEVQENLAGSPPLAADLSTAQVDNAQIAGSHESFANQRRRADYAVFTKPNREIAVIPCGEALSINSFADFNDLL